MKETLIDEDNVHNATLRKFDGESVRVTRDFKGARIINLESKIDLPYEDLIGQTIKDEKEFQFSNAYADAEDPEVVVVTHNETGEDFKVRKTFHGARIVDNDG